MDIFTFVIVQYSSLNFFLFLITILFLKAFPGSVKYFRFSKKDFNYPEISAIIE